MDWCIFLLFLTPGLTYGSIVDNTSLCRSDEYTCSDGECVDSARSCRGAADCAGSGQRACSGTRDGSLGHKLRRERRQSDASCKAGQWQCENGACISHSGMCDGVVDCPDRSDESLTLCGSSSVIQHRKCILPPHPAHGTYHVHGDTSSTQPGDSHASVLLTYSCFEGYVLNTANNSMIYCLDGTWYAEFPKCLHACRLDPKKSLVYRCFTSGLRGNRSCNLYEPVETLVNVECAPNYYSSRPLHYMRCYEDGWNSQLTCTPDCGRITPEGTDAEGGRRGELPWYVAIYRVSKNMHQQICGGTLISDTRVISAAHCFWSDLERTLPPSGFAVAAGKIHSAWDHPDDVEAQKSEVREIRIPPRFLGGQTYYQEDIAVLTLKSEIVYGAFVRPVCLDLDTTFDRFQWQTRQVGKIASWRRPDSRGAGILQVTQMKYLSIQECLASSPIPFRAYITSDKNCAAPRTPGPALCKGDGGAGLAFLNQLEVEERYYLSGILSVSPTSDTDECANATIYGLTSIVKHGDFIKEASELAAAPLPLAATDSSTTRDESSARCVLPAYPQHGSYTVEGVSGALPGRALASAVLTYKCDDGYRPSVDLHQVACFQGTWFGGTNPTCVRRECLLEPHPSVEYHCRVSERYGEYRACGRREPLGTVVHPSCREPLYYSPGVLPTMRCLESGWNYHPVCLTNCGRLTPAGTELLIGGRAALRGEIPWHAGIYRRTGDQHTQICGGSIVSTTLVITAAHCFWRDNHTLPASSFAVAVGKVFREWDNANDTEAQKFDVEKIVIPPGFRGSTTNFQHDIALVILQAPIRFEVFVRPVCLDFDHDLERRQLAEGVAGKVAGWGLTAANGVSAPELQVIDLPFVDINKCLNQVPLTFRELVTTDKFCAGYTNGSALCQGDSGGGLAFPESAKGVERYFLRGIVSTAPRSSDKCTQFTITTFTQVTSHMYFIKDYL